MHRCALGQYSATALAIQGPASALTSSIWAQRCGTQELEEGTDGLLVAARRGPKQAAGVVVEDDGDVSVAASMADLAECRCGAVPPKPDHGTRLPPTYSKLPRRLRPHGGRSRSSVTAHRCRRVVLDLRGEGGDADATPRSVWRRMHDTIQLEATIR